MISSKKSVVKETNAKVYSKPVLSQKLLSGIIVEKQN